MHNSRNFLKLKQVIDKADQIVPFFVMDVLGDFPGLPGLFVAGIFSGALRFTG